MELAKNNMLKVETKTEVLYTFNGKPVSGRPELLQLAVMFLAVSYEHNVERVFQCKLEEIDPSWLKPSDKGGLALFGVNAKGEVIFGAAMYDEGLLVCPKSETECYYDEKEWNPAFQSAKRNRHHG
jgi:hypothetical protein